MSAQPSSAPHNLILAGFMGTGKSAVGHLVAEQLGWHFVDTDVVIEARAGKSIAQIFAEDGEGAFREFEAVICSEAGAQDRSVIAVGGGALLNSQVTAILSARGLIICLTCDLDEIIRRVGDDPTRPLYTPDRDRLARLLAARAAHYASFSYQIDTTRLRPQAVAEEIMRLWQQNR